MSQSCRAEQEVASPQLLDELVELTQEELLAMDRLLQEADTTFLFGATEFQVRDLALKLAAKLYHRRLEQKKTATRGPA
jgi:hypothetical protein